jgi:hypothetical protein
LGVTATQNFGKFSGGDVLIGNFGAQRKSSSGWTDAATTIVA